MPAHFFAFSLQGRYWQFSCTNPADPNCQPKTGMTAQKFLAAGVKVVNVHQGVPVLNPYINYPFEPVATQPLSDLATGMHAAGGKMKLYYTTRVRMPISICVSSDHCAFRKQSASQMMWTCVRSSATMRRSFGCYVHWARRSWTMGQDLVTTDTATYMIPLVARRGFR